MMEFLSINKINLRPNQPVPPLLESLLQAARRGEELVPYVLSIAASFGFDSFEYGVSGTPHPDKNGLTYYYSTMPDWIVRYDRMGYIEIDPRVFLTCKSAIPLIWDQSNLRKFGSNVDAFLDDAIAHGIASGVSFMWHGPYDTGMAVTLNSRVKLND
ncbi:MAG TPA: autoinducer binding domain-containing protein, partial [Casimicrobiaceae bacterium]|nr:autoinducer binding domain-containing protein [Casimicrobiaceae bacterium]